MNGSQSTIKVKDSIGNAEDILYFVVKNKINYGKVKKEASIRSEE